MKDLKFTLVLILAICILVANFFPQLFLNKIYSNGDPLSAFYPIFSFYKNQITTHQSILWTQGVFGGFPAALDISGGFYSPLNYLLFKNLSVYSAYNLALFFAVLLLFFCSYAFMRQIEISRSGSLLGAIAFTFGYHNMLNWSNNLPVVNSMFILPLIFLSLAKIRAGKYYWIAIGIVGVGYALLVGQPQWVLMAFVAAGLYVLYLLWCSWGNSSFLSRGDRLLLLSLFAIVIGGVLIASFQLIPSNSLAAYSARANGLSYKDASILSQTPFDWVWFLLPDIQFQYLSTQEPTLYIGVLSLLFALLAIIHLYKKKGDAKFFILLFLFGIFTAIRYSPFFWAIHQLPVFQYFRAANRWLYVGNFGLAVLAGMGLDLVARGAELKNTWNKIEKIFKWLVVILLGFVASTNIAYWVFSGKLIKFLQNYYDKYGYQYSTKLPLGYYHSAISSKVFLFFNNINLFNIKFFLALIFLVIGYLFILGFKKNNVFLIRNIQLLSITVVALNLILLHPNYYEIMPRSVLEQKPSVVNFLEKKEGSNLGRWRTMSVFTGLGINQKLLQPFNGEQKKIDMIELDRDLLDTNLGMIYGVDTIDGYGNLMPRRNSRLLAYLGSYRVTVGESLSNKHETMEEKLSNLTSRLPLFSMLNVKYLVSALQLPATDGLDLVYTTSSTRFHIPVYVYENTGVLPRIYFANDISPISDSDELKNFDIITKPTNDFKKVTLIECNKDCKTNFSSKKDTLVVSSYKAGSLEVDVYIERGRWLVFSESDLPNWQATIDGQPTNIYNTNYIFQGVYIPAGEHEVKLEYKIPWK